MAPPGGTSMDRGGRRGSLPVIDGAIRAKEEQDDPSRDAYNHLQSAAALLHRRTSWRQRKCSHKVAPLNGWECITGEVTMQERDRSLRQYSKENQPSIKRHSAKRV
jgi:hypothetical protein